jgi:Ca-activated chloride channel family protein
MIVGAGGFAVLVALAAISLPRFANTKEKARFASRVASGGQPALERAYSQFGTGSLPAQPADPGFNTEQYAHIVEHPFLSVAANALSTFSIDVDRASYSNVRRFIRNGVRPPRDAVRLEELVNYFTYDYPEPSGRHPFSVTTEVAAAPWKSGHLLLRIGLKGRSVPVGDLPPNNLVFLADVSGSMNSPDKLPLLQAALTMLVDPLRPQDRVALVAYAGAAGLVLPSTPGDRKAEIAAAIAELEAGGSTAGGAGIQLAYAVAREHHIPGGNNRVILATDGDCNVGVSSDGELVRLIEQKREQGTFLTVLGFGTGNLQDAKMEQLADHGNGNYAYVDDLLEARKVLVTEMGGTLLTIAKDVKIQVEFNPARVRAFRLLGYENRALAAEDFADDRKDAGEMGAGHTVTALYEIVPVGVETDVAIRGMDALRYREAETPSPAANSAELGLVKVRYKEPDGTTSPLMEHRVLDRSGEPSQDLVFASAVAGFGMILRESEHRGSWTMTDVLAAARRSVGTDAEGYRAEFSWSRWWRAGGSSRKGGGEEGGTKCGVPRKSRSRTPKDSGHGAQWGPTAPNPMTTADLDQAGRGLEQFKTSFVRLKPSFNRPERSFNPVG